MIDYAACPCNPAISGTSPATSRTAGGHASSCSKAQFVAAMERAFELGLESRASAAGQVKLAASTGPRWTTPLTREIQEGLWRSSASALVFVTR